VAAGVSPAIRLRVSAWDGGIYKLEITIVTSKTQVSGNQDLNKNRSQIVMSSRDEIGRISRFVTSHIQGAFDIPIWKVKRPDAQGHLSQNT
jgi:hypothetical protein